MKQLEYIEGQKATQNFEEGMKSPLQCPQRQSCKPRKGASRVCQSPRSVLCDPV
jgi:hypothetical protein